MILFSHAQPMCHRFRYVRAQLLFFAVWKRSTWVQHPPCGEEHCNQCFQKGGLADRLYADNLVRIGMDSWGLLMIKAQRFIAAICPWMFMYWPPITHMYRWQVSVHGKLIAGRYEQRASNEILQCWAVFRHCYPNVGIGLSWWLYIQVSYKYASTE